METPHKIIIAGAGGIAEAAALLLAEWSQQEVQLFIGNRTLKNAQKLAQWVKEGTTRPCSVESFHLDFHSAPGEMLQILDKGQVLLDCLPGKMAPQMAQLARTHNLHYINLTEYVAETNQIMEMAARASTGFVLQSGIAPGYIDVLAHGMYQQFCLDYSVDKVEKLEFKVGALTLNAVAPHYYGFTWSPVGVATEYIKDAIVVRDYKKTSLPALSQTSRIIINGIAYEDDLTSGGAADLPDALSGKVKSLDYKTLRHPGHYDWVKAQIKAIPKNTDIIPALQKIMEKNIPHYEDDRIVLYAAVEGYDADGTLRRREVAKEITSQVVGKHRLRAIQTTTAVPMLQAAQMLLDNPRPGVILQSQIEPTPFLNGHFVKQVYGEASFGQS